MPEPEQEEDMTGAVNEFGIGGLYLGGDVDSLEAGWRTVTRRGKTVNRMCMGSICAMDRTMRDKNMEGIRGVDRNSGDMKRLR